MAHPSPPPRLAGQSELLGIEERIRDVFEQRLRPLDQFGLCRKEESSCRYPMVLLTGPFSSGKSSFVNSVLGEQAAQEVGAAPTDCAFTLLLRSDETRNQLVGSSLLNDPELGFSGLKRFPSFESRIKLKCLGSGGGGGDSAAAAAAAFPPNTMLVDSPGLTDFKDGEGELFPVEEKRKILGWFAARSDMILFFFDPLKPGGDEQKEVLLDILRSGQEGKLRMVFNKVDQLQTVQDFVMTFGTLCWTLAKVFPRKEPPAFYTTFTPGCAKAPAEEMAAALKGCEARREDLMAEIAQVPFRRADNLIKEAEEATESLQCVSVMANEMVRRLHWRQRVVQGAAVGACAAMTLVTSWLALAVEEDDPLSPVLLSLMMVFFSLALAGGCALVNHLTNFQRHLATECIDDCFAAGYFAAEAHLARRRGQRNAPVSIPESAETAWHKVKRRLQLRPADVGRMQAVGHDDLQVLRETLADLSGLQSRAARYREAMSEEAQSRSRSPST